MKRWSDRSIFAATPIDVYSTTAIDMVESSDATPRTKHVEINYHHVPEIVSGGVIYLSKVPTEAQLAEELTKVATNRVMRTLGLLYGFG